MGYDLKAWRKKKYGTVTLEMVGDHIVIVYFDNPPVNAGNIQMVRELDEIWLGIREDGDIRCSVVSGVDTPYKGKHYFCAGADVKAWSGRDRGINEFADYTIPRPMIFPRHAYECEACYNTGKPSIAMVNGTAVGFGADWAIQCDITLAAEDARIGWVYILRGIAPYEGGTWLLPRRIGVNRAMELLTTGEIIDAQEAFRLGIYNKVYPHDQLREATLEYAQWYAEKGPPLALGATRSLVYMGLQQGLREHLEAVEMANGNVWPDREEAMLAWVEKRDPKYKYDGAKR